MTVEFSWINYLARSPLSLVLAIGMVYALITWNRHRMVSLFAFLGCLTLLVLQLGWPYLTTTLIHQMNREGAAGKKIADAVALLGIVNSLLAGVGMACLLGAAFGWRKTSTPHP